MARHRSSGFGSHEFKHRTRAQIAFQNTKDFVNEAERYMESGDCKKAYMTVLSAIGVGEGLRREILSSGEMFPEKMMQHPVFDAVERVKNHFRRTCVCRVVGMKR